MSLQKRPHIRPCSERIPQRHGNIALPTFMPYTPDRAALGALQKFGLGPFKYLFQGQTS